MLGAQANLENKPFQGNSALLFSPGQQVSLGVNELAFQATQPWTVMAAVQLNALPPDGASVIFTNVTNRPTYAGYELVIDQSGHLLVRIISDFATDDYIGVYGLTNLADGKWHVVSATYDGSSTAAGVRIYEDGTLLQMTSTATTLTGSIVDGSQVFSIGNQENHLNFTMDGAIDDFWLADQVYASTWISQHSSASTFPGATSGTVLEYNFDEGQGTIAHDSSGSGFNGTLTSSSMWYPTYSATSYTLPAGASNLVLTGDANISAAGNALPNDIVGNNGNNRINGEGGADTMAGGLGNDTYWVDNPGDVVIEAPDAGIDTVISTITYTLPANVENLTFIGGSDLSGAGNDLNNILTANSGNDRLNGEGGNDTLVGGTGSDTFIFSPNFGMDLVSNFVAGDGAVHDFLSFGSLFPSYASVMRDAMQSGSNVVITYSADDTVTLAQVTLSTLVAQDFIFPSQYTAPHFGHMP
jgi:hypothetical protein